MYFWFCDCATRFWYFVSTTVRNSMRFFSVAWQLWRSAVDSGHT